MTNEGAYTLRGILRQIHQLNPAYLNAAGQAMLEWFKEGDTDRRLTVAFMTLETIALIHQYTYATLGRTANFAAGSAIELLGSCWLPRQAGWQCWKDKMRDGHR